MATHKKAAKPASKKPAAKATAKKAPVKKPAKTQPRVKKPVKGAKPVVKKSGSKIAKSSPKKAAKSIKNITPAKKSAKPVAKKAAPKKLIPVKKLVNPTIKPVAKKAAIPVKKTIKPEPKKVESKKPELKPLPKAKDIKIPPPKPVVLPKITTTKSRKYEPEFTRSVLDQAPLEQSGPTMRYSDGELNEFRELIQRKLETAKKELGYLQGLITRKDEMGGDDTDNRYMTMEDGSLSMEREQLSQMASRQITFIDHLEKAMMRIENKTYGICRVTGKLIDKARLRAVPHATLSIEAKMGIAK